MSSTVPPELVDDVDPTYWLFGNIFFVFGVIIGMIITIIHTKNVYSDLFTKNRLSISHRNKLPKLTSTYKIIRWTLLINMREMK